MKITHFNPMFLMQEGSNQSGDIYHNYYIYGEKIRPQELEQFGYRLTARHILVGDKYKVFELLPINSSFRASHSFLAPNHRLSGVIIPRTFNEHKAKVNPITALARHATLSKGKSHPGGTGFEDSDTAEQTDGFRRASHRLFNKAG